jgi:glycosyltransferase involved in cell wall biosynthesis
MIRGIKKCDFVICISESTKADLLGLRPDLDPARVLVIYWAASDLFQPCNDPERIAAVLSAYGVPSRSPYILSVATLAPHKNIETLIRVFHRLTSTVDLPDLRLVLAGAKGWKADALLSRAGVPPAALNKVIFTGYISDEDLPVLYSGALVFAYPSLYEGFGLPLLEAMKCGTPVVSSNTSSLPEVIGEGGVTVSPQDEEAWLEALIRIIDRPEFREKMRSRALKQASKFSWERSAQQTLRAYAGAAR